MTDADRYAAFLAGLIDDTLRRALGTDVASCTAAHADADGWVTLHLGTIRIRPEAVRALMEAKS